ncbi:hypothetical protein JK635_07545 [Neobacillus sp. YIM B02564]|uniref:Uncharacterized protein n=1 Tax=Neobacillus paridis TaxID=2803862 RepID=A0ABS1TLC6_9BACI|nr:hypothetical protein [Neobacillus paridis]MBL4952062.1 hypothetical protein [Neobacillus paridis]
MKTIIKKIRQLQTDKEVVKKFPSFHFYLEFRSLKAFKGYDIFYVINEIKTMLLSVDENANELFLEHIWKVLLQPMEELEYLKELISNHFPKTPNIYSHKFDQDTWWFYYSRSHKLMSEISLKIRNLISLQTMEKIERLEDEY